jgi:hypothetical protein
MTNDQQDRVIAAVDGIDKAKDLGAFLKAMTIH